MFKTYLKQYGIKLKKNQNPLNVNNKLNLNYLNNSSKYQKFLIKNEFDDIREIEKYMQLDSKGTLKPTNGNLPKRKYKYFITKNKT